MQPKLIIFDFDGTLANTTALILWTFRAAIDELGVAKRTDIAVKATIGLPLREGFRQLYPNFSDAELDRCVEAYRRVFNENKTKLIPKLYPGVTSSLEELHRLGIEMSIASSRSNASLIEFCKINRLTPFFKFILGADDVVKAKPNPEPVFTTLAVLKKDPKDAIVVGDMPVDIAMGRRAGCCTVGVTYGNSCRQDLLDAGACYIIDKLPQLLTKVI